MGDLRGWSPEPNGEDRTAENGAEIWRLAEDATQGIIAKVQPTAVSEKRRKAVVDFVQGLLKFYLGCEVFPFGSVPLKTYLPDGDIDLTAFCGTNHEEAFANDVYSVLESQERNTNMEFVVKDVQLIRAEVKLIKCLVQNIVVDISFTQLGGLCTLNFLEQVDRLIGKDHLFKRSIILIKAWCYYESRILGAHHGLISTYALETLVLYIFHVFHYSLNGPLAVLYKFLDYFSNFDWDNYCISLNGPVRISNLPELTAEPTENGDHELLLSDEFLKGCVERFSAPCDPISKTFPQKHFNIVDPLKENNNLGRSVSKGNFFRIRSAFSYGARKLGRVLSQAEDNISPEVQKFFSNTLERHGKGQRPDILEYFPMQVYEEFRGPSSEMISRDYEEESANIEISGTEDHPSSERESVNGNAVISEIGEREEEEDEDQSLHRCFSHVSLENGETKENGYHHHHHEEIGSPVGESVIAEEFHHQRNPNQRRNQTGFSDFATMKLVESSMLARDEKWLGMLADLSGDYESHIGSLNYGRWFHECALTAPISPVAVSVPQMVPHFQRKKHFSQVAPNGVVHRPPFYHLAPPILSSGPVFGKEEIPKPRGTGTYFPNANHYRDRPMTPRGRNQAMLRSPRSGNGRFPTSFPAENGFHERNILRDAAQPHFAVHIAPVKSGPSDEPCGSPHMKVDQNNSSSDHFVEFGTMVHLPPEPPLLRGSWQANLGSSVVQNTIVSAPVAEKQNPVLSLDKDRISAQAYRLKDEDDFPPLSV